MQTSEPSDELIDLIASGHRTAAILACYRTNGGDLDEVNRLSQDLGESNESLPQSAAVDPIVKVLRAYGFHYLIG